MNGIIDYINYTVNIVLGSALAAAVFVGALAVILIYMVFWLKRDSNRKKFDTTVKWIFLEVKVDELNEKSALAMEQVFAALHAIHTNFTWGEDFAGNQVLTFACEIVSLGGRVSFIFKIPERFRNLLESAIFAQYPKAEINEVEDYLKNLPHHYDPETADFDFFGTQLNKKKESAYPIKTYAADQAFEHGAQETFIDPLSNVIEVMSNLQPYELLAYQLVLKPVNDDWKAHTVHLIDKLKGAPHKHDDSIFWKAVFFIPDLLADALVTGFLGVEKGEAHQQHKQEDPPSQMLHKTDVEKKVIAAIENGLGKIGYEVRFRLLYLAPKGKLNTSLRVPEIIGAVRNFDDVNLNGMKPDIQHTWTGGPTYKISELLERPYLRVARLTRKRHFLHNFVPRSHWRGSHKFIMNTEELATVYHFPQVPHSRVSQLEKVHTVKSAPPMDLPIG